MIPKDVGIHLDVSEAFSDLAEQSHNIALKETYASLSIAAAIRAVAAAQSRQAD